LDIRVFPLSRNLTNPTTSRMLTLPQSQTDDSISSSLVSKPFCHLHPSLFTNTLLHPLQSLQYYRSACSNSACGAKLARTHTITNSFSYGHAQHSTCSDTLEQPCILPLSTSSSTPERPLLPATSILLQQLLCLQILEGS
jgi:hypothetical protein